jgi:transposase-like protein
LVAASTATNTAVPAELAAQWRQQAAQAPQGDRDASAKALAAAREDAARQQQEAVAAQQELSRRLQEAEARLRELNAAAQVPGSFMPPEPVFRL